MPPPRPAFVKYFCAVTAGESQQETAAKLRCSQALVSTIKRGYHTPGAEIVRRMAQAYGGDEEEWLKLAGYRGEEYEEVIELVRHAVRLTLEGKIVYTSNNPMPEGEAKKLVEEATAIFERLLKEHEEGEPG
jgi:transcriptional regulator with XRE-family HTH domain